MSQPVRLPAEVIRHEQDILAALTLAFDPGPPSRGLFDLFGAVGADCYRTAIVLLFELLMAEVRLVAQVAGITPIQAVHHPHPGRAVPRHGCGPATHGDRRVNTWNLPWGILGAMIVLRTLAIRRRER